MKWKVLKSQQVLDTPFCKFRIEECELPDKRVMPRYYVLDFTDWVNVVPVTSDGEIILIRQYRHGSREVTWEVPGGAMHPKEDTDPQEAALRELTEETGYKAKETLSIGVLKPNPALQSNALHTFVSFGCELKEGQRLDPFEDIEVKAFPISEVYEMAQNGEISHALMVSSLFLAQAEIRNRFPNT